MKFHCLLFATVSLAQVSICGAQGSPKPEDATAAVLRAFETHDIVMLVEIHGNKQEYDWLRSLAANPAFGELDGTPYGKEIERRLTIQQGQPFDFIPEKDEEPQFPRPKPDD